MADLKFYYHGLESAEIDSITSEATGYPKENLQDRSPHRVWKATGTANQTIDIDLNESSLTKDFIILSGHNLYTGGAHVYIGHDDNSSFSSLTEVYDDDPMEDDEPVLLAIFTGGATTTERYWRIILSSLGAIPQIGAIFIGSILTHPVPDNWPRSRPSDFSGITVDTTSGGIRHSVKSYGERKIWVMDWESIDETHKGYFDTWKDEVEGPRYPFYFADENGDLCFVRAMQIRITPIETVYQMYNIRLTLEEEL